MQSVKAPAAGERKTAEQQPGAGSDPSEGKEGVPKGRKTSAGS